MAKGTVTENRYVRLRCPECGYRSPVCDQRTDVRRSLLHEWWVKHREAHLPYPIIERAEGPE